MALGASEGLIVEDKLKSESLSSFCAGLVLFSLATSILFTPLPIFFSKDLAIAPSFVFAIFVMNSGGGCIGYFFARNKAELNGRRGTVKTIALIRGLMAFFLTTAILYVSVSTMLVVVAILIFMGFAYALFLIFTLSISMELLPQGKAGLFNVLVGIGGATGCFIGPLMAASFSFFHVFLVSSLTFFLSYLAFKIFAQ